MGDLDPLGEAGVLAGDLDEPDLDEVLFLAGFLPEDTGAGLDSSPAFFLGSSTAWMLGSTPPDAMVTPPSSLFSSSSLRTASWMWRGVMR